MESRKQGYTLVELMIVIALIATIASMAIPNLLDARMAANEGSAISSLRTIATVNEQYRNRFGLYSASLENLEDVGYLDEVLGHGEKSGYDFDYSSTPEAWHCVSMPDEPGRTGKRYFFIDQTGVIRFSLEEDVSNISDPLE